MCLTEDKRCRCGVKKRRDLVFISPKALFMGFRWWQGCLCEPYPNCLNLLGLCISGCKFHENRTSFSRKGEGTLRALGLPVLEPLEMRQTLYFRISFLVLVGIWIYRCAQGKDTCAHKVSHANTSQKRGITHAHKNVI
jgi:hypothetical protein